MLFENPLNPDQSLFDIMLYAIGDLEVALKQLVDFNTVTAPTGKLLQPSKVVLNRATRNKVPQFYRTRGIVPASVSPSQGNSDFIYLTDDEGNILFDNINQPLYEG